MKRRYPLILSAALLGSFAANAEEWFDKADHGPAFIQTYGDWFKGEYRSNSGLKAIRIAYGDDKKEVAIFNMETLSLVSATDQGVILDNTPWGGKHGQQNKFNNKEEFLFTAASGPGWANASGSFKDNRQIKDHGNLDYAKFNGYFRHGKQIILDYTVLDTRILDSVTEGSDGLVRTMEIAPHDSELTALLSSTSGSEDFSILVNGKGARISKDGDDNLLKIAPSKTTTLINILYTNNQAAKVPQAKPLGELREGGEGISPDTFVVEGKIGDQKEAWQVDQVPVPDIEEKAPYFGKIRTSDFDFFKDGNRALICTWDGDVWLVSGLNDFKEITWKRYATGFFEPLGLKIVDEVPYVGGRDGIWKITDLNGDDEADHFEIFNNDVIITNNFHEFQFGLETDKEGNFYFAKASPVLAGGRGFDKILPNNGTFMRVSADGYKLDVLATGLRAPGGIGVGPDGQFTTGENEGTWQPCCKINYFEAKNGIAFFGTEDSRHDAKTKFTEPLCYLPMDVDNSGGSQIWVTDEAKIGLKADELIHLSYGQSSVYRVLTQKVSDGFYQGGVTKLPVTLSSSAQRADFHPDGSLYVCGMRGWQTNAANNEGFQRIRHVEDSPILIPNGLEVTEEGIKISFETELDAELAEDPASYHVERWKYIRSKQYGSGEFSVDKPDRAAEKAATEKESKGTRNHDLVEVTSAKLSEDKKSVLIQVKDLKPAQQMRIDYDLESANGEIMISSIINTVHKVMK